MSRHVSMNRNSDLSRSTFLRHIYKPQIKTLPVIKSFGAVDFKIHYNVLNYVAILQKLYIKMNNNTISYDISTQL